MPHIFVFLVVVWMSVRDPAPNGLEPVAHRVEAEVPRHASRAGRAKALALGRTQIGQRADRASVCAVVPACHHLRRATGEPWRVAAVGGDAGQAERHGFEQRVREAFVPRRQHKQVESRQHAGRVAALAQQVHPRAQPARLQLAGDCRVAIVHTTARRHEMQPGPGERRRREGAQQRRVVLLRREAAKVADQHGIAGNAQFAPQRVAVCTGAGQRLRVKAIGDDV